MTGDAPRVLISAQVSLARCSPTGSTGSGFSPSSWRRLKSFVLAVVVMPWTSRPALQIIEWMGAVRRFRMLAPTPSSFPSSEMDTAKSMCRRS